VTARKPFALRIDPALHDAIERAAAADLRSVNAEIETLLREALARRGVKVPVTAGPRRGRPPG
jgi:hypothetical protein